MCPQTKTILLSSDVNNSGGGVCHSRDPPALRLETDRLAGARPSLRRRPLRKRDVRLAETIVRTRYIPKISIPSIGSLEAHINTQVICLLFC